MDVASLQQLPEEYRDIYQKNWSKIKETVKHGRIRDVFHFPLINNENREIILKAEQVVNQYTRNIKINVAFGFVLKNQQTQELKFFHPSNNTLLFSSPKLISNPTDFQQFKTDIEKEDAVEYARLQRPSTIWTVDRIICVRFDVYSLSY